MILILKINRRTCQLRKSHAVQLVHITPAQYHYIGRRSVKSTNTLATFTHAYLCVKICVGKMPSLQSRRRPTHAPSTARHCSENCPQRTEFSTSMKALSPDWRYTCCRSKLSWIKAFHSGHWKQNLAAAAVAVVDDSAGLLLTGGS